MQILVKAGFLHSIKRPAGGFVLAKDPKEITIFDIIKAIDGTNWFDTCILRVGPCDSQNP
jgi:Rrf2 family iron-sulfur cluster assembly transcriptional regulator